MKKTIYILMSIFMLLSISNTKLYADDITNYIILNDIAPYQRYTEDIDPLTEQLKTIPGYWIYRNSGVLMGTDHFLLDHNDVTYKAEYQSKTIGMGVVVQVTQHAGGDSDKWLLHEVEDGYRRSRDLNATYSAPNPIRIIDNNKIWFQWGAYTWLRNNIVVSIEFTDLQGTKPEPIEVVQAYLAKFPSTITLTNDEAKAGAHNVQWIKDEMERRLWLCDKWSMQLQLGKVSQADMLEALVKHMIVFLNYRQKYYGVSGTEDIKALRNYLDKTDGTSIKNKLAEYKTWWNANKGKSISI